jgi:hypothetical protein
MADDNRHAMDEKIQPGDVVVSHVNGTRDFYIIATVLSTTAGDLTLHSISTMMGQDAAILYGYERQKDDQAVWLFAGSAGAYVKAPPCDTFDKPCRIPGRAAMNDLTLRQPIWSEAACRHLAVCVIQQAVRDLSGAAASRADQESARTFLAGSPMFYRWCEFANLNAARTVARATKLMAGRLAIRTRIQDHASAPR